MSDLKFDEVNELLKLWPNDVPLGVTGSDGYVFSELTDMGVVGVRIYNGKTVLVCALGRNEVMGEPCEWWRRAWKGSPETVQTAIRDAWNRVKNGTPIPYPPEP